MSNALLSREDALVRRIELRALAEIDPDFWADHDEEFEQLNEIVGLKDCDNCGRDYDLNYPDRYCPMCVASENGAEFEWEPRHNSDLSLPDIPEVEGAYVPWCEDGLGELRCMYPAGHGGRHRFMIEWEA